MEQNVSPEVRAIADGIKLALQELAEQDEEHELLPRFLKRVFGHLQEQFLDGTSKWAGKKLIAYAAGALFAFAVWLLATKGGKIP